MKLDLDSLTVDTFATGGVAEQEVAASITRFCTLYISCTNCDECI
jgi:hypothetical protein